MIETTNKFMVSMQGDRIIVIAAPRHPITRDDAINLAAWLVALADDLAETKFATVLAAIKDT